MKIIRAYMDINYRDGEAGNVVYFLYDSDVDMIIVNRDVSDVANIYFEDYEFLAPGDIQDYYDNDCYYTWNEITEEEMIREIKTKYGDVAEAEIHDYRIKERN